MTISLNVNGETREFSGDPDTPLLWVIRDDPRSHRNQIRVRYRPVWCMHVHVDGCRCVMLVTGSRDAWRAITTIEGLSSRVAKAVRKAWIELDARSVRLLPVGRSCPPLRYLRKSQVERPGHRPRDGWQYLRCATYQSHSCGDPPRIKAPGLRGSLMTTP